MSNLSQLEITAKTVADQQRSRFLPNAFPGLFLRVENAVYDWMGRLSVDYKGGSWNFVCLSNGGAFMWPQMREPVAIRVDGNDYEGTMSPEAAGIVACLLALSHLSFSPRLSDSLATVLAMRYDALRQYAAQHAEASAMLRAID